MKPEGKYIACCHISPRVILDVSEVSEEGSEMRSFGMVTIRETIEYVRKESANHRNKPRDDYEYRGFLFYHFDLLFDTIPGVAR